MNDFDQRMAALRARFARRCPSDAAALRAACTARDRAELRRILHAVAGNAGVFGYPELSASARRIEEALEGGAPEAQFEADLHILLLEMEEVGHALRP